MPGEIALLKASEENPTYIYVRIQKDTGETVNVYVSPEETQVSSNSFFVFWNSALFSALGGIHRSQLIRLTKRMKEDCARGETKSLVFDSVEYAWSLIVNKVLFFFLETNLTFYITFKL